MSKYLKILLWIVAVLAVSLGILILIATLTDYEPEERNKIEISSSPEVLLPDAEFDVLIWNIGYAGLDADMDFFYDGGEKVRPPEENVFRNLEAIEEFLEKNDSIEFFLLQEVDVDSKRSYRINQYDSISNTLHEYQNYLALNYKVFFVPLPVINPMGRVVAGLATYTPYQPAEVYRYSFPGNYQWPKNLFMLDRCFLVNRHPVSDGKELLIINTHNSAYDDGSLREKQMEYLKKFMLEEYEKGNYILAGGDWNQSPPGFKNQFDGQVMDTLNYTEIEEDYLPPAWQWVFDPTVPTNRRVSTLYERGSSLTTLIDFFLVSPNINVETIKGIDLNFQHSDHQPVILKVKLNATLKNN